MINFIFGIWFGIVIYICVEGLAENNSFRAAIRNIKK